MSTQVISFNCTLKNSTGKLISTTFNREVLTSVEDPGAMLLGLAKGLQNLKTGEKRTISLRADEAYGYYDPKKVILISRNKIPKQLHVGEFITLIGQNNESQSYRIIQFHDDSVSLDGNHPLAGQDLVFEIETVEARAATAEEIQDSQNLFSHQQLLH